MEVLAQRQHMKEIVAVQQATLTWVCWKPCPSELVEDALRLVLARLTARVAICGSLTRRLSLW
jgi:hypothetical protein